MKVTFNLRQLVMPRPKRPKGFAGDWLISNQVGQDYGESRLEKARATVARYEDNTIARCASTHTHTHIHIYAIYMS